MKKLQLPFTLGMFLLLSVGSVIESREVFADDAATYWGNSSGEVWMSGTGECWSGNNGIVDPACGAVDGDSDGDGVLDSADKCPGTPSGAKVDSDGCALDSDGDGVLDYLDKCPGTSAGAAVDNDGCPLDSDGDGVLDYLDKCPGTPRGTEVDANGCKVIAVSLGDLHFATGSAKLTSEAKSVLDGALANINAISSSLTVEGHTDSRGSESFNLDLSQRRAQSVVDYLVSKSVSSSRLNPIGKGEGSPVASNDTREGRYQNRRVEVTSR